MEQLIAGPAVHDLLQVTEPDSLVPIIGTRLPPWAAPSLDAAPWVVVRRAPRAAHGALPVGIRGRSRSERAGAWLPPEAVTQRLAPEQLPGLLPFLPGVRRLALPALDALEGVRDAIMPFELVWGPGGSIGFELATGVASARPGSDLDLIIRAEAQLPRDVAVRLATALTALPVPIDAQLETPHGAVSLVEYGREEGPVLLRTVNGPRLMADPWQP
jgi:phosphoribosyl-dephospho-CoA transferase